MWPSLRTDIPVIYINNYYDYHGGFLNRCDSLNEIKVFMQNSCTRFMYYGGTPKLVVSQTGTVLLDYLREHLSFDDELYVLAGDIEDSIVKTIMDSSKALEKIVDFAGSQRNIQMISWASSVEIFKLAQFIESQSDVVVYLPEVPSDKDRWLQEYLDTKNGFRSVTSTVFNYDEKVLPEGFTCLTEQDAVHSIQWFLSRNQDCIAKSNKGCLGKGLIKFDAADNWQETQIKEALSHKRSLLLNEPVIVEQKIFSPSQISPSAEFYIPPVNQGTPQFTYLVKQCFQGDFQFVGNLISKELTKEPWYDQLLTNAHRLAERVQQLGYVGYIDVDCIVDQYQNPYFVEVNPRRTGGTHYHELAIRLFGEEYLEKISLISNSNLLNERFVSFKDLYDGTSDLLYSPGEVERGIIFTEANLLASHRIISVASIGKDVIEATQYLSLFQERISSNDTL